MITRLEVENFISLRSTAIDFAPLTVLLGGNGTGKSAIFKALTTLSRILTGAWVRGAKEISLYGGVTLDDLVWNGDSSLPIRFRIWLQAPPDGRPADYELELRKSPAGWSVTRECYRWDGSEVILDDATPFLLPTETSSEVEFRTPSRATLATSTFRYRTDAAAEAALRPIRGIVEAVGFNRRYRPSALDIANFVRLDTERSVQEVGESGYGTALALQNLAGSDFEAFERINQELTRLFPHVTRVGFRSDYQGVRLTYQSTRSQDLIPAPQESDGVLLATFLLWRLVTAGSEVRLCLEEPEAGLHPDLVGSRYALLQRFAYPTLGQPVQILVSTHSPILVRQALLAPREMRPILRLVDNVPGSGTRVEAFNDILALKRWAKENT